MFVFLVFFFYFVTSAPNARRGARRGCARQDAALLEHQKCDFNSARGELARAIDASRALRDVDLPRADAAAVVRRSGAGDGDARAPLDAMCRALLRNLAALAQVGRGDVPHKDVSV